MGIAIRRQKNVGLPALPRSAALADLQSLIESSLPSLSTAACREARRSILTSSPCRAVRLCGAGVIRPEVLSSGAEAQLQLAGNVGAKAPTPGGIHETGSSIFRSRELGGVFPPGFAGDDVGIEVEKDSLAGLITRLLVDGEIELPPVRERQVR